MHKGLKKPSEDMELFPPEEKGFSYIMLFDDGVKIDLIRRKIVLKTLLIQKADVPSAKPL